MCENAPNLNFCAFLCVWCVGAAAGGDTSEAELERPNPPAGGGEEHLDGAAGGGGGGKTQPGKTAAVGASSGTVNHIHSNINYFLKHEVAGQWLAHT